MPVQKAQKSDKKDILRFYKQQRYSSRFLGGDVSYIIRKNEMIIASVIVSSLETTNELQFLHGLVVDKQYRNQSLANQLLAVCQANHPFLVCFCEPDLQALYLKKGFKNISQETLKAQSEHLAGRLSRYQQSSPLLCVLAFKTHLYN